MFSNRNLRILKHRDSVRLKKEITRNLFTCLRPRPRFFPLFFWKYLISKIHYVSINQLKKIK